MVVVTFVEALPLRVVAAADVVIAYISVVGKDSSAPQQTEGIALTYGGVAAVVVSAVVDAEMADQNAGALISPVADLSLFEVVAVPISPEQDSSAMAIAAAAAQTDHCLPGAPSSQVQYHPTLLALIGNVAVVAAECSWELKIAALTAVDYVGNFELQAAGNAVDPALAGYQ